jgi:hypothetical protein
MVRRETRQMLVEKEPYFKYNILYIIFLHLIYLIVSWILAKIQPPTDAMEPSP